MKMIKQRVFIRILLVIGLLVGMTFANSAEQQTQSEGKFELQVTKKDHQTRISMDFKDADIRNVLRAISYQVGVNIIAGPEVSGNVTLRIVDAPWEDALSAMLKTYGYVYQWEENIIRVTTPDRLLKEDVVTEVYQLKFVKAEEIADAIKDMLSGQGKVQYFNQTNSIVVTDIPSKQKVIKEVIERLDSKTRQVMIEASMVEVSLNKEKELGIKWNIAGSAVGAARPITFPFDVNHTGGDFYPPVDSSSATTEFTSEGSVIASEASADFAGGKAFPYADPEDFTFGYLSFTELQARLSALQTSGDANLISCPRIVTLDNHEAEITVGTTVPIPIYERNEQTGSMEITGYDEHDFGVTLKVTPYINQDGYITMDITPEVNEITGFTGPNNERPITATRKASTRVMIKDGLTVVIGGLLKDSEVVNNSKVPLLGDIPLLGYLFRSNKRVNEKVDLLIFITPRVVEDTILMEADRYKLEEIETRKLSRVAENAGDAVSAHIEAGKDLMEQGKTDEAVEHFKRALQIDPKNKDAEKLLKKCELQTSQPTLVPIPEGNISPSAEATADQYFEMGLEFYKDGNYEEAMKQFEKSLEIQPNDRTAKRYISRCRAKIVEGYCREGVQLYKQKSYAAAEDKFRQALAVDPNNRQAKWYMEKIARLKGESATGEDKG